MRRGGRAGLLRLLDVLTVLTLVAVTSAGCDGGGAPVDRAERGRPGFAPAAPSTDGGAGAGVEGHVPWPRPADGVAGARAARRLLVHPDVSPSTHVAENGDVLTVWRIGEGERDRSRCRTPVAVTWSPRSSWMRPEQPVDVRAWLVTAGRREVTTTSRGFFLGEARCLRRTPPAEAAALALDSRGLRPVTVRRRASTAPRDGSVVVTCPSPLRAGGRCQLAPGDRVVSVTSVAGGALWDGTWHDRTSLLFRSTEHITRLWSRDGGATWQATIDPWDAAPFRFGDSVYLADNGSRAGRVWLVPPRCSGHEGNCGPEDATPVARLPRSRDGYRTWGILTSGTLFGSTRTAAYVSAGTDWGSITRRPLPTGFRHPTAVGDLLVATNRRELAVSEDHGHRWRILEVDDLRP